MKKNIMKFIHSSATRRVVSGLTAFLLLFGCTPLDNLSEEGLGSLFRPITAYADSDDPIEFSHLSDDPSNDDYRKVRISIENLSNYSADCEKHREYHQFDKLIITSTGDTTKLSAGFKGLGDSTKPFGGSVDIEGNASIVLNIDAPLFNCVYDDVVINQGNPLQISREYGSNKVETTPLLATSVKHRGSGNATWKINIVQPSDDEGNEKYKLGAFGGIIGTMTYDTANDDSDEDSGAKLNLEVTMNKTAYDDDAAIIKGAADLGFACGKMEDKTQLSFKFSSDRGVGSITTTSGNAGGLVGSMSSDSTFTYIGVNPQTITDGSKAITTNASGFAGAIVGKNDKGTVNLNYDASTPYNSSQTYTINQIITGKNGAGGIYGYFMPSEALTGDSKFKTEKYSISCQTNGDGNDGGLFGVLDLVGTGFDAEILGSAAPIVSNHALGSANAYGGLIGLYKADANKTITVTNAITTTSKVGGASCYGGGIGVINDENKQYVKFVSFTTDSSNAGTLTYGGLVASAKNAFVDVNAATVTASGHKGGGLVGDLDHGVLRMNGSINLSNATPSVDEKNEDKTKVGKVVGYRDDGLVFLESECTLSLSSSAVDDIGAWGHVINNGNLNVLSVNETTHQVTIASPSTGVYTTIANKADYAKTALCFQLDASKNNFVDFANVTDTYNTIKSKNISLSGNIDLSSTGLSTLTRDNDIGSAGDKCIYSGTFNGNNHTITFDSGVTNYRHSYYGLFAVANSATVKDATFAGTINVSAQDDMYAGAAAATAKGSFTATGLTVNTTFNHSGAKALSVGGVLGEAVSEIASITIGGTDSDKITANATITGSASNTCLGGVIGKISHATNSATLTWSFSNIDITGSITNTASLDKNQVGGLVAVILGGAGATSRTLDLDDITVKGLNIRVSSNSNGSVGGVLGYSWAGVDADFDDIEVGTNVSDVITTPIITQTNNSAAGVDFAGLVYSGSGYWTVKAANDIKITALKLNSEKAQSFGMILNRGWIGNSDMTAIDTALYLELQNASAYSITDANVAFKKSDDSTDMVIPVFDELVAHTAFYTGTGASKVAYSGSDPDNLYILQNGQGIVSIQTSGANGGLTMNGSDASGTYTPATTFGKQMNPFARYYYNLYSMKNSTTGAAGLMSWGAKWYAHSSIKSDVSSNTSWGSTIPNGTYNMQGYSWYPLNIDSTTVTIKESTFTLYNREFEGSEDYSSGNHAKRTSLYNSGTTQHYLMQSALFNNVNGKLNVEKATLQGSVPLITAASGNSYSGALVRGTVKGSGSTESGTAKVTTSSIVLDGVYVYNFDLSSGNYAPLLINKTADYSTLSISGVSNTASYYTKVDGEYILKDGSGNERTVTIGGTAYPKAATSLIGNVGYNENSKNVNVNFSSIKLDGRNSHIETSLDSVYDTQLSLFTKATLLNKLSFDTGKGIYTYTHEDDWGATSELDSTPKRNVTYGKEVGYIAATYNSKPNQYPDKERQYLSDTIYTDPRNASGTGDYASTFRSSYLPYVATEYNSELHYYQLEVNHASATFSGCGTYNDPYILVDGDTFLTIYDILSNSVYSSVHKIFLPMKSDTEADLSATWHGTTYGCKEYIYTNDKFYLGGDTSKEGLTTQQVRTYVAGAYYKIVPKDGGTSITIPALVNDTGFKGLGNTSDNFAKFRGVIVGTGNETIVNKSGYPLVSYSNGSVVKGINIIVDMEDSSGNIGLSQDSAAAYDGNDAKSYGAVIGTVLGGDNIIDNVTVTFQNTTITLSGKAAQFIPVGGYVGVILNGGVIFRGMEGKETGISGLPAKGNMVRYSSNGTSVTESNLIQKLKTGSSSEYEDNMKWLYVNPIIGRVINGYAVTEASAYRPFDDGTRTYGDGTIEYWLETKNATTGAITSSISTNAADKDKAVGVTMRNGNKHYSIADISLSESKLDTKGSAANIEVPNGQAFFIMSLAVNSGMSAKKLGYNQNYQISRLAKYTKVEKNLSAAPDSEPDYYVLAKNDSKNQKSYIWQNYTVDDTIISGKTSDNKDNKKTLKLTTANGKYYLPDGYKGIGNFFQSDDNLCMMITNFDGNGATISQNTYFYYYDDSSSYSPVSSNKMGLGLINYTTVDGTYQNFYLAGNLITDLVNKSNGAFITNKQASALDPISSNTASNSIYLSAGMLIGTSNANITVNNTALKNVYVFGLRNTGGMIGYLSSTKTLNYTIMASVADDAYNSDIIKVHGRASTGGLVGKINTGYAKVDMNNHTFNLTEVVCECTNRGGNYYDYGVGGFIGMMRAGQNSSDNEDSPNSNYFKNIIIGTENQAQNVTCTKGAEMFTAGVVGIINKCKGINIENCTFYNLSVEAKFAAAGLVAFPTSRTPAVVSNTHLYSPLGSTIESTADYAGGLIGSSDPRTGEGDGSQKFTFNNCSVEGYTISGKKGAGGAIGFRGAATSPSVKHLVINNTQILNCIIKSDGSAGGLIGEMNEPVIGYNILSKNVTLNSYTKNGSITNAGYICGRITTTTENVTYSTSGNGRTDNIKNTEPTIKISGFSRQADDESTMEPELVGACNYGTGFGTGGYVIFADYNDNATNNPYSLFSNVYNSGSNVATMRSVTTDSSTGAVSYGNYDSTHSAANTAAGYVNGTKTTKNENYPFVTSSPQTFIDGTNFLTGDGIVGSTNYTDSNFYKIISDTTAKKYTIFKRYGTDNPPVTLTDADKAEISEHYTSTGVAYNNNANVLDFPLLEVNDVNTENTTRLINNYINVLANTNYNYAAENNAVYKVDFYKYRLDTNSSSPTYNQFVYIPDSSSSTACLSVVNNTFRISADNVDTGSTPQFTLMDIQYMDPSGSDKVAYHLYIPVYVNQLLRYTYKASLASNTDYIRSAYYKQSGANISYLFENLGNPVTMEFEYDYQRTPSEWAEVINGGFNVLKNYYKTLNLNHQTYGWPADTHLVLVDASNNDKFYYMDNPSANCDTYIDLYDFVENDGSTHYTPAPLQNLMKLTAEQSDDGSLVRTTNNTAENAIVLIDNYYYRKKNDETDTDPSKWYKVLATSEVTLKSTGKLVSASGLADATVKYNGLYYRDATDDELADNSITKYESTSFIAEKYYLSFFTKKSDNSGIYHFEIQTRDTFEADSTRAKTSGPWTTDDWHPNKLFGSSSDVHIILGDLYENDLVLNVTPMETILHGNQADTPAKMRDNNYYLKVTMTATVKLKESAKEDYKIDENLQYHPDAEIYQTFLMTYDMLDSAEANAASKIGIITEAGASLLSKEYYIKAGDGLTAIKASGSIAQGQAAFASSATNITSSASFIADSQSFFELRNGQNLRPYLADSSHSNAATLQVSYEVVYDYKKLSKQFPMRTSDDQSIGTKVIAYSNISSSLEGAAYSSTTISKEDHEEMEGGQLKQKGTRYYTKEEKKAVLTYDVDKTDTPDDIVKPYSDIFGGRYSYLGINALETANSFASFISSNASYDLRDIQDAGQYVELTISLSAKTDAEGNPGYLRQPNRTNPFNNGTALDITQYLQNLKVYDKDGNTIYDLGSAATSTGSYTSSINGDKTLITIRVARANLAERGANSNIYDIPITYEVKTGNSRFNQDGYRYSNYKVLVTAVTYSALSEGTCIESSYSYDHLIYTNARVDPSVK